MAYYKIMWTARLDCRGFTVAFVLTSTQAVTVYPKAHVVFSAGADHMSYFTVSSSAVHLMKKLYDWA